MFFFIMNGPNGSFIKDNGPNLLYIFICVKC